MSDFNDRPLVAGSVMGLRSFAVDKLGRLTGVSHKHVWTPGENVAKCSGGCAQPSSRYGYRGVSMSQILYGMSLSLPTARTEPDLVTEVTAKALGVQGVIEKVEVPEHRPGGIGNSCGYWAFFDGSNDYHTNGETVAAIVEGYGTVTIGTRGFRAEKARIAALVIPPKRAARSGVRETWRRYAMFASRHEVASVIFGSLGIVGGLVGTIGALAAGPTWIALLAFPILLLGVSLVPATLNGNGYRYERRPESSIDYDRIRQNYPDVPVFATVKDALKAYPVAHPEPPSAITPETHEDFWTRSAS